MRNKILGTRMVIREEYLVDCLKGPRSLQTKKNLLKNPLT